MRRIIWIVSIVHQAWLFSPAVMAQDTLHATRTFEVVALRDPGENPGLNKQSIQTSEGNRSFNLGELLSRNTSAFIKQYTAGGLASPSLRGTGAAHTALLWHGINLQSSMNGQQDLSLIPAVLFDRFDILEGSSNAAWGSGAIGGSIFLESDRVIKNRARLGSAIGSYGFSQQFADVSISRPLFTFRTRFYSNRALNNFKFEDVSIPGNPVHHQQNATAESWGMMQDIEIRTGKHSRVEASVWHQESLRQIPPILTVPFSVARQNDVSSRASLRFITEGRRGKLSMNLALLDELIHFSDSMLLQDARNRSRSYIAEFSYSRILSENHVAEAGFLYTHAEARADGYGTENRFQRRPAVFASLRSHWFKEKTKTLLSIRQEFLNGNAIQPQVSFSFSQIVAKHVKVRGQAASTYRIPTLNDLYWLPGGNPDLQSEQGFSLEGGLDLNFRLLKDKITCALKPGIFMNRINNWIQWTPLANYWTPVNLQNVRSLGAEVKAELNYRLNTENEISLSFQSQRVHSEIVKNDHSPDLEGRRLIYVPSQTSSASASFRHRRFNGTLLYNYVSARFVTTDNSEFLPDYHLFHFSLSWELISGNLLSNLFFQINNLGNTTYHVVLRRPMPLRTWQVGIQFEI